VIEICQRRQLKGTNTLQSFIDFRKAYDLMSHDKLFNKVKEKGLGPLFIESQRSLYKGTNLRVRCRNAISEAFSYNRGVRQGCPTSPLLFDIYIDDLFEQMQKIRIPLKNYKIPGICYADDTQIMATTVREMESKMKALEEWTKENAMEINVGKCGLMTIAPTEKEYNIKIDGSKIPQINEYKYLGVQLNDKLDMENYRIPKGNQGLDITN
jgi:hypothetical protein